MLNNNSRAFDAKRGRPPYLKAASLELTSSWLQALNALDDETLQENFADVLDNRRISALAKRRDQMLGISD
jgi:hypothetical protein